MSSSDLALATKLVKSSKIPLYTCPTSLTWVILDYFDTLPDEIKYIWVGLLIIYLLSSLPHAGLLMKPGSMGLGKLLFFSIRYYTILAVVFDVAQIHSFSKFNPSLQTCVAMDATIRVVGAISLWTIEIIMQLRIYALYNCSKRVAAFNAFLFLMSIGGFLWILIHNAEGRAAVIGKAKALPIPGCPVVHTGIEWAQWIPATVFEGVLFTLVIMKSFHTFISRSRGGVRTNGLLFTIIVHDNLLYFFGVSALLVLNNLMVVNVTHIPWFSYSPFHAALGIMTSRMLLHLHKAVIKGRAVYSGANTGTQFFHSSFNAYPMQVLSTRGSMSWNCERNAELGSVTLVGNDPIYTRSFGDP